MMIEKELNDAYFKQLEIELENRNIEYSYSIFGIQYSTGLDSWLVVPNSIIDGQVVPILYHKNLFKVSKLKKGHIPDFHIQLKQQISPKGIVEYTVSHNQKYNSMMFKDFDDIRQASAM